MKNKKNVFVSHQHDDAERIEELKSLLKKHGFEMRDSSIYENKNPNNAHNEDYIKSIIRPKIDWASTIVVLIGEQTSSSDYVNWEIEHANREDRRIVGVYLPGKTQCELPEALIKYGDALQKWNAEKIIDAINGNDEWNGPGRNWSTGRTTC